MGLLPLFQYLYGVFLKKRFSISGSSRVDDKLSLALMFWRRKNNLLLTLMYTKFVVDAKYYAEGMLRKGILQDPHKPLPENFSTETLDLPLSRVTFGRLAIFEA